MENEGIYAPFLKKTVKCLAEWISGGVFLHSFAYAKAGL